VIRRWKVRKGVSMAFEIRWHINIVAGAECVKLHSQLDNSHLRSRKDL